MQPATHENQAFVRSILMIYPEERMLEVISQVLSLMGYPVEGCQSGREGIEIATRTQPDLMIVELGLPDIDGLTLLQRLRAREIMGDRPIIVLTSLDDPQVRLQANSVGISGFISNPFDIPELFILLMKLKTDQLIKLNFGQLNFDGPNFDAFRSSPPYTGFIISLPSWWKRPPHYYNFPRCPHCRAGIRPGDSFCLSCGPRIPPATDS